MIRLGNKILETTIKAGRYPGRIIGIEKGEGAKFEGQIKKDTIDFLTEFYLNGRVIEKTKPYIVSKMKSSELMQMVNSLLPDLDIEKDGIDLQELIGMECTVEIRIDTSRRGNRFENIGAIRRRSLEAEEDITEEDRA